jgi:hypothetical protein
MKFTDYVKIEQLKNLILANLEKMGLKEQVRAITEEDLKKMMLLMGTMSAALQEKNTDEERIEMLSLYIICLWTRLIVDYGADLEEM